MNKIFIFVLFLFVSCNNTIGIDVIDYSFGLCENNGGLESLEKTMGTTHIKVCCNNGAEFNFARLWDESTRKHVLRVIK